MRRRIIVLVTLISTALVASFVIPLLLLVRTLAEDRGMAVASRQANTVAVLVSSLHEDPRLADLLQPTLDGSPARTSVLLADGQVLGAPWPGAATDPDYRRARQGEAFSLVDATSGRVYVPVLIDGGVAVARATMTSAQLAEGVRLAWMSIIALGLLLSGAAVAVAAEAGARVSRPVLAVAATAHSLRAGDLDTRAPLTGPPETVELGSALNRLAERVEQLLAAERESVRGLAHRLRTPVTALRLEAESVPDPDLAATLASLIEQLQAGIDDVVRDARRPLREDLSADCDAAEVVAARVHYWTPLAEDQARPVELSLPRGPLRVPMSALDLADVIDICLDNIFAHTPEGVGFTLRLTADTEQIRLTIADTGPGFSVHNPSPRPGFSGEGLRIARRLTAQAGGQLNTSAPGIAGGTVTITMPLRPTPQPTSHD